MNDGGQIEASLSEDALRRDPAPPASNISAGAGSEHGSCLGFWLLQAHGPAFFFCFSFFFLAAMTQISGANANGGSVRCSN